MAGMGILALTPRIVEYPPPAVRVLPSAATPSAIQMGSGGTTVRQGAYTPTAPVTRQDTQQPAQPDFGEPLTGGATAFLAQSLGQDSTITPVSSRQTAQSYTAAARMAASLSNAGEGTALLGGSYMLV